MSKETKYYAGKVKFAHTTVMKGPYNTLDEAMKEGCANDKLIIRKGSEARLKLRDIVNAKFLLRGIVGDPYLFDDIYGFGLDVSPSLGECLEGVSEEAYAELTDTLTNVFQEWSDKHRVFTDVMRRDYTGDVYLVEVKRS